jgi:hypothetical protein
MTRQRTLAAVVLAVIAAAALVALGRATAPTPATPGGYADGFLAGRAEGVQEGQAIAEAAGSPPASRDRVRAAFDDGYRAGANNAFGGYDGGWSFGRPYVIVLAKGANGITYRIAARAECPETTTTSTTSLLACQTGR